MKKILCFFGIFAVAMIVFSMNVFAAVHFTTAKFLPPAYVNTPYSTQLEAEGDSGNYEYSLVKGLPAGLSVSPSGLISGTPTVGGVTYSGIRIQVRDIETNSSEILVFSLKISAVSVQFEVTNTTYKYDGKPHRATVVPYINGENAEDRITDYSVTYGGELSQTDAGVYYINIQTNTPGYKTGNVTNKYLTIMKNSGADISFPELVFTYDGSAHAASVSITYVSGEDGEVNLPYSLTYEGLDSIAYGPTQTPPVLPGRYRVTCNITDSNFITPVNNISVMTILPKSVNFTLQSQNSVTYDTPWTGQFVTEPEISEDEYSVSYVKDGISYDTPGDVGVYRVNIEMKENSVYGVGTVTPGTINVLPKPADFAVSPTTVTETSGVIPISVTTGEPLTEGEDYTVFFTKDGVISEVKSPGRYEVGVNVTNPNYTLGEVRPSRIIVRAEGETEKTPVHFEQVGTAVYSGEEQKIRLSNTAGLVEEIDYTVEYSKDGVSVNPRSAGAYDVSITFIDGMDEVYRIAGYPKEFVIEPKPVYFTIMNTTFNYNGAVQAPDITNDAGIDAYTVSYKKDGVPEQNPVRGGVYSIDITVTEPNYVYGGQNVMSFEILADKHSVTVNYNSGRGAIAFAEGSASAMVGDPVRLDVTPRDGYFTDVITVTSDNVTLDEDYGFIMPDEDVTINVTFRRIAAVSLNFGNSVYGMIEKNSAISDKETAKEQFLIDRLYGGKYFSAAAWGEKDMDADDAALIVYNRVMTPLPKAVGHTSEDGEAELTVTFNAGDKVIDLTGQDNINTEDIPPGLYSIEYKFFDDYLQKDITAERKVVILWNLGDVNLDRNTNGADANWLTQYYQSLGEESDYEKLFKFRMCDVDKDGVVGESDIRAILERMSKRIQQYYR